MKDEASDHWLAVEWTNQGSIYSDVAFSSIILNGMDVTVLNFLPVVPNWNETQSRERSASRSAVSWWRRASPWRKWPWRARTAPTERSPSVGGPSTRRPRTARTTRAAKASSSSNTLRCVPLALKSVLASNGRNGSESENESWSGSIWVTQYHVSVFSYLFDFFFRSGKIDVTGMAFVSPRALISWRICLLVRHSVNWNSVNIRGWSSIATY